MNIQHLQEDVLEILSRPQYAARNGAPLSDVVEALRSGFRLERRWRLPGRSADCWELLEQAGFTVDHVLKATGEAGARGHGTYWTRVSL